MKDLTNTGSNSEANPFRDRANRAIENWARVKKKYQLGSGRTKVPPEIQRLRMEKAEAKRERKRKARSEACGNRAVDNQEHQ